MYGTGTNGTRDANDIIVWTGTEWDTATPTGYVEFTYDAGTKTVSNRYCRWQYLKRRCKCWGTNCTK